ncbi:MAG: hypothetical protein COV52_09650 [Gammaproteobacteria bacterium CG11_big_fil_rev_8_21_14_0_20_46_22]|nr:MAG: hypothetical protein COV52_09650 [Gammaproteobacteria bacterium CG11_big_fil_rev_8_21_14_0_20_46_22]
MTSIILQNELIIEQRNHDMLQKQNESKMMSAYLGLCESKSPMATPVSERKLRRLQRRRRAMVDKLISGEGVTTD